MSKGRGSYKRRQRIRRTLMEIQRECFLCLEPLDFSITDSRDPDFVVIDEYVPVSKGGDPLDPLNCNLVHARCNGRKGNRILRRGAFADKRAETRPRTSREWL